MRKPSKTECILILKRVYDAPIERVWDAWTNPAALGRWYVAGDDHIVHSAVADVRVGGDIRIAFGPPGAEPYVEIGHYVEVTPMTRLVMEAGLSKDAQSQFSSRATVEFIDLGDGRTQVVLTDVGDEVWRSGEGWMPCLESLARYLDA